MAASDASIYWNLKLLSQKLLGKGISTSADQESGTEQPVGLQRRLLTAAYAVLLDTGPQVAVSSAVRLWPEARRGGVQNVCVLQGLVRLGALLLHKCTPWTSRSPARLLTT